MHALKKFKDNNPAKERQQTKIQNTTHKQTNHTFTFKQYLLFSYVITNVLILVCLLIDFFKTNTHRINMSLIPLIEFETG